MSEQAKSWSMARVVTASSAGTAFEWYDFFIFGSLTPVIAKVFLAGLDPTSALIAALALFAVGFAFRPLGAIIFGAMGDRVGRKATFLATVSLMGGATFAIGLLPTYAQAGIIAPILLIILRICQGTALGGEYGGAAIYVAEHADDDKRGSATGWIQSSASIGLLAALFVIVVTRTLVGAEAFDAWGWRIPFLLSAILLAISVWMRLKLSESPAFAKLRDEGAVSKTPLREAFARRDSLRQVLIAFFAIMCAQGAVWYFAFFYIQVFLEKSLGMPAATKDMLLIAMTLVSAPLYVMFGALSDRIGRKPVMLGGMLLALALYFPGSHLIASSVNPALVEAQGSSPVTVVTDTATCAVQFDPTGTRRFDSACDIAKSLLVARGISYETAPSADGSTRIAVGRGGLDVADGAALDNAGLKSLKTATDARLKEQLVAAGYPASADPGATNYPVLLAVLFLFVVAATALYGPQAAALVEMFPTRVRYTAMSLPYHIGTGWVGGFLPVTGFAIVAITGDIYAGLWYPVVFTAISIAASLLFWKEKRGQPLV
ncbi:MFS transporter [Sphingomonas sp. LY29]|uniref:MFS transporter n=1 Tax=Sphingomonas sp. LY29 TaxID=3095341 RepID=UPI002D782508|nr:MFS transporter [Sphingomonas sp. LY29]WRP26798.1 MFS transporter [Sphingomonas sp. LY29]